MIDYNKLTGLQVLKALIAGIDDPVTDFIDMDTFGRVRNDITYGCAATQALLILHGKSNEDFLANDGITIETCGLSYEVRELELALDHLRFGEVSMYNSVVNKCMPKALLPSPHIPLQAMNYENFYHVVEAYRGWLKELESGTNSLTFKK